MPLWRLQESEWFSFYGECCVRTRCKFISLNLPISFRPFIFPPGYIHQCPPLNFRTGYPSYYVLVNPLHFTPPNQNPTHNTQKQFEIKTGHNLIKTYTSISENNVSIHRSFCSECGSPVYIKNSKVAGMIIIPTGSLNVFDSEVEQKNVLKEPEIEFFVKRKCPWLGELGVGKEKQFQGMS